MAAAAADAAASTEDMPKWLRLSETHDVLCTGCEECAIIPVLRTALVECVREPNQYTTMYWALHPHTVCAPDDTVDGHVVVHFRNYTEYDSWGDHLADQPTIRCRTSDRLHQSNEQYMQLCTKCVERIVYYGETPYYYNKRRLAPLAKYCAFVRMGGRHGLGGVTPAMAFLWLTLPQKHIADSPCLREPYHRSALRFVVREMLRRTSSLVVFARLGDTALDTALALLSRADPLVAVARSLSLVPAADAMDDENPLARLRALPVVAAALSSGGTASASPSAARARVDAMCALSLVLPSLHDAHEYGAERWKHIPVGQNVVVIPGADTTAECVTLRALLTEVACTGISPLNTKVLRALVHYLDERDLFDHYTPLGRLERALDIVHAAEMVDARLGVGGRTADIEHRLRRAFARAAGDEHAERMLLPPDQRILDARAAAATEAARVAAAQVHVAIQDSLLVPWTNAVGALTVNQGDTLTPIALEEMTTRPAACIAEGALDAAHLLELQGRAAELTGVAAVEIRRCAAPVRGVLPLAILAAVVAAHPDNLAATVSPVLARVLSTPKRHANVGGGGGGGKWTLEPRGSRCTIQPAYRSVLADHVLAWLLMMSDKLLALTSVPGLSIVGHGDITGCFRVLMRQVGVGGGNDFERAAAASAESDLYGACDIMLATCSHTDCRELVFAGGVVCARCGVALYCSAACMQADRVTHTTTPVVLAGTLHYDGQCAALCDMRDSRRFAHSTLRVVTGVGSTTARLVTHMYVHDAGGGAQGSERRA